MRILIKKILAILAKAILRKYRPEIIAITGSVGKTSTKDAVALVLQGHVSTFATPQNLNTEFGVPMTIIGGPILPARTHVWKMAGACIVILCRTLRLVCVRDRTYPRILVLEMGADKPGDIEYLVRIAPPHIAILTAVQSAHLEGFKTIEAIEKEKKMIYSRLTQKDWIVLNADESVTAPPPDVPARVFRFRRAGKKSIPEELLISKVRAHHSFTKGIRETYLSFHVSYGAESTEIYLPDIISEHCVSTASYAISVGLMYGIPLESIAHALSSYQSPKGRMRLIAGVHGTLLIDDTYNASPAAMKAALNTLKSFEIDTRARRWTVLGDMFEMGESVEEVHREVGRYAGQVAIDFLVTVGPHARTIAEEAAASGLDEAHIFRFDDPIVAARFMREKVAAGDLILVKGSQGIRLEKCVKELMAQPERANELLVRQTNEWK